MAGQGSARWRDEQRRQPHPTRVEIVEEKDRADGGRDLEPHSDELLCHQARRNLDFGLRWRNHDGAGDNPTKVANASPCQLVNIR